MKHTEIPHTFDDKKILMMDNENQERILQHGDKVVYAAIRRFMNEETRSCYPSISKIKQKAGCGQTKVEDAIKRLEQAGFIKLSKKAVPATGKLSWFYEFTNTSFDKHFEMFTDEFLDLDLPINVKEYYMDIQRYMYDKESGTGKISFSNTKIAELTGWSIPTIKKFNTILIEKGLLDEVITDKSDEAGLPVIQKNFNLAGLQQAALWAKAVTQQVVKNTSDIEEIKSENEDLKRRIAALEREAALRRNLVVEKEYTL